MFSQTAEYALRAMVCMANMGRSLTTSEIAEHTQVPSGYLSKVLQALGRADLVAGQRGLHGGFSLTRPPSEITILDVVNAVDPIRRITRCPLDLKAHARGLCPLHRKLDDALAVIEASFSAHTLEDLMTPESSAYPLGLCPQKRR